jgi:O-antigen biosynthesis protein
LEPTKFIDLVLSSPFVDDRLYHAGLGADRQDIEAADLYLKLPVLARPRISYLFDRRFYVGTNPDIGSAGVDPFIHFVVNGCSEARSPHPLINIPYIVKSNSLLLRGLLGTSELYNLLHDDSQNPSPYFSRDYYQSQISQSSPEVVGLLEHFLQVGLQSGSQPNAFLDLHWYYRQLEGAQDLWSGLRHFVLVGDRQGRSSSAAFSGRRYWELYPDVAAAGTPPLLHYLTVGIAEGRTHTPGRDVTSPGDSTANRGEDKGAAAPEQELVIAREEQQRLAMDLFRGRAESLLPLVSRNVVDFTFAGTPELSVVMILGSDFALAIQTLISLRQSFAGRVEILLVDAAPVRQTRFIDCYIRGVRVIRLDSDVGLVHAADAAIACATANAVLLLGSEVELAPAAISLALSRLYSDPAIGAVGAKLIGAGGRLLEAGGIIDEDGTTRRYMQAASPLAPEANFVRDVDFCSGALLLVRADLLHRLEGRWDDIALCVRIAQAGFRVVYDPSVVGFHYRVATNGRACGPQPNSADHRTTIFARSRFNARRVLFIEDQMPLRRLGSGFVRSNDLLRTMAKLRFQVTVFPMLANRFDTAAIYTDIPDTVEAMHDLSLEDLPDFLDHREGYYETIWVARTHNLDWIGPILERHFLKAKQPPRIILDTEAIASLRDAGRARVNGTVFDLDAALATEFRSASLCNHMIAVTEDEARLVRGLGFANVSVIGHVRDIALGERGFSDRCGLLFLGAIHEVNSPNLDSIHWFVDAVLPLIETKLGFETRLTIAGYIADDAVPPRFDDHPRITFRQDVTDTTALYNMHRVFVAPTRFAAGAPYKLYEAASFGLPIVATELLRQQVGWEDGRDILSADVSDPSCFANQVVRLYRDPELWQRLRDNAASRLADENAPARYVRALEAIL